MAVFGHVEVNLVQLVHHLTDDGAVFHVVVDAVENVANQDGAFIASRNINFLESGNQLIIDKVLQGIARHAFAIGSPVAPLQFFGDNRLVVVLHDFHFGIFIVNNLERYHPAKLFNSLCIARNALVFAHNVLQGFDNTTNVSH